MKVLELNWTISRAKDTDGYNVITLLDGKTKYKAMGGGYDMTGTVFGQWLWANYKDLISEKLMGKEKDFYGFKRLNDGKCYLDGACGLDCMLRIAKEIGLSIESYYNVRKKCLQAFIIK